MTETQVLARAIFLVSFSDTVVVNIIFVSIEDKLCTIKLFLLPEHSLFVYDETQRNI